MVWFPNHVNRVLIAIVAHAMKFVLLEITRLPKHDFEEPSGEPTPIRLVGAPPRARGQPPFISRMKELPQPSDFAGVREATCAEP